MNEVKTAVIVAGGAGLRMYPLTEDKPKCMIEVSGRPLLFWILKWLKSESIENVVIGVAYKNEVIREYLQKNDFDLNIKISEHTVEGETGEGFRLAIDRYVNDENFFAMNGDQITNMDLKKMIDHHIRNSGVATIAIAPLKSPFGIVEVQNNNIIGFKEKPLITDKFINSGIYAFNKRIKEYLPKTGSIEKLTFPKLAEIGALKAYRISNDERWTTMSTVKDIETAEEEIELIGFKEQFG